MTAQDKRTVSRYEDARCVPVEQDATEDDDASAITEYEAATNANEESFPALMVERLIAGEHPLKVFREYRGLSDEELAQLAGGSLSVVRQIEDRERQASTDERARFADVLHVDVEDLS